MKKLIMLIAAFSVMPLMAATGYANGYTWTYRISGGTAEIEGVSPEPTGTVTIPSTLGGKPVTSIGNDDDVSFYGAKSVIVPASVKYIGYGALDAETLKSLVLPTWCKNPKDVWSSDGTYLGMAETGLNLGHSLMWHLNFCCCKGFDVNYSGSDEEGYQAASDRYCEAEYKKRVKITFKDVWNGGGSGGGSNGGSVSEMWKKAQTLQAVLRNSYSGDVKGVIQVKVGKANKNGQVSISGTITGLDGKKKSAKGGKVTVSGSSATATLAVKDGTTATVTVDARGVSGSWNGCQIVRATIGGEVWKTARFDLKNAPDYIEVAGHEYYVGWCPYRETVEMRGRKWHCEKAGRMKWTFPCCRNGLCLTCGWECCGWEPIGDTNINGLKLSYNMNTGTFKGSFNLYMTEDRNGTDKGVKKTVNVSGVLVDGVGYGIATLRGFGSWPVTIR